MKTRAIILAAGKGKRINADLPKALHNLCGKPLVGYILERCAELQVPAHIVIGHRGEEVEQALGPGFIYAEQKEQLGTGHAVLAGLTTLPSETETVAVFNCDDSSFYRAETLVRLLELHAEQKPCITMVTVRQNDPTGLGRIIKNSEGQVIAIREERLASHEEKAIKEVNAGAYIFNRAFLEEHLPRVERNQTGEYFLTDLISIAAQTPRGIACLALPNDEEYVSINTPEQLAYARERMNERLGCSV